MKLSDAKGAYEVLSGKASDINRQLGFAGIALIWVFKQGNAPFAVLDTQLLRAALFIALALTLDFVQYLTGAATWYLFFRLQEQRDLNLDRDVWAPDWINRPTWVLFWIKVTAMMIAYGGFLVPFLVRNFSAG
jgi:hypothetical protein